MSSTIEIAIRAEAQKQIKNHEMYLSELAREIARREARTGLPQQKTILIPEHWKVDHGFNPYYVRRKAKSIARSIERSLANRTYRPRAAFKYLIPKSDGGTREVAIFQIADSALSLLTFKRLMDKNARHLSASAYAYRSDLSIHDAILHIASDLKLRNRVYLAEFDFKKFFDTISHSHILKMLGDRRFFVTLRERFIISQFLGTPSARAHEYLGPLLERSTGIHQGTSISLFLANIAAYPLDRRLERLGVGFARYADDTLIWSDTYSEIGRAANALEETAIEMGVNINFLKSKGITLLAPPGMRAEIPAQNFVDFIGYKLSQANLSIRDEKVRDIKKKISFLIYKNLLQQPKRGFFNSHRMLGSIDQDYPVVIYQLRRYLYGGLSESMLRKYLVRQIPKLRFKGLMSFYPIVDDEKLLRELDGWMLSVMTRALSLRGRLWASYFPGTLPTPHGCTRAQLLQLRHNPAPGHLQDLRFPSFLKISRLLRRASTTYGPSAVANAQSSRYHSSATNTPRP